MATHSGILPWEISWTEEAGGLQSMGLQSVGHTAHTHDLLFTKNNGHFSSFSESDLQVALDWPPLSFFHFPLHSFLSSVLIY